MRPMTLPRRANRKDARPWNGPDTLIVRPSRISMDIESDLPWHVLPPDEALARLESSRSGLDRDEVERRLSSFGPNSLPPPKTTQPALRFLAQFNSALIYFLLAAAVAAGVVGHLVDAGVILAVVIVNAIVGHVQEGKEEQAMAAIRSEERRDGEQVVSTCRSRGWR